MVFLDDFRGKYDVIPIKSKENLSSGLMIHELRMKNVLRSKDATPKTFVLIGLERIYLICSGFLCSQRYIPL